MMSLAQCVSSEANPIMFEPSLQFESSTLLPEPILAKDPADQWITQLTPERQVFEECEKRQTLKFWNTEEISFAKDYHDWTSQLSDAARKYFLSNLAFFANSDNIVLSNCFQNFVNEIGWSQIISALMAQAHMEAIHAKTYREMIRAVVPDTAEQQKILAAVTTIPTVAKKLEYCISWLSRDRPFHVRVVAWAFIEGVGFASAFASFLWLRKKHICPGLGLGNEKIMEDECEHVRLSTAMYRQCVNKCTTEELHEIAREIVAVEDQFIDDTLEEPLQDLTPATQKQYVRKVADVVLELLEPGSTLYGVENPYHWMSMIGSLSKANFFEKRVGEYQRVGDESALDKLALKLDDADLE